MSANPDSPVSVQYGTALMEIARQFETPGAVTAISPLGNGNINDTFRVSLDNPAEPYFVLQRINTSVFRSPHHVMQNMCRFTEHVRHRLSQTPLPGDRPWQVPRVLYTQDGCPQWQDSVGGVWRAISFIADATTFDTIQSNHHAWEVGYGLGTFHQLISDLSPAELVDTLPGFHVTPGYLEQYQKILVNKPTAEIPEVLFCTQFIQARAAQVSVLERGKDNGDLSVRLIHGDPKVNNVLISAKTHQAISLVDLDTVKPGLIHYDIGDCLRSGCNRLGEESREYGRVNFDIGLCEQILGGYYAAAKGFLDSTDLAYLYSAVWLITFELGLRFFTDYLAGNLYFKTHDAEHNLRRALVQFKLLESIENQKPLIMAVVDQLH